MKNKSAIYSVLLSVLFLSVLFSCKKEAIKTAPTVSNTAATNITATTASAGGDIVSDGGTTITAKGICWSTNQSPTTSDSKTTNGTGTGGFSGSMTGLTPGATYNVRAYATNSVGTGYSSQTSFTTLALLPVLTTTDPTSVTSVSASSGGNITNDGGSSITARGVCWGSAQNPTTANSKTTDGTGSASFTSAITGLTPGTTYYVRAYATNSIGTAYGNQVTAITTATLSTVTTTAISAITSNTATSGGNITSDGGAAITARGVCWNTSANPTTANSKTTDGSGTGSFTSSITGLTPGATYYVKAYATNSIGTAYGSEFTLTTTAIVPVLTTNNISAITTTTATSGGNISADGGSAVTARGVCWSTTQSPTTANSKTIDGSGTGGFTSSITGLSPGITYYIRAYATNSIGTAYGNQVTSTTTAVTPSLTTSSVTAITATTILCGGIISSDGGSSVSARGICWSTSSNPTIANSLTNDGTGSGNYASSISGLTPVTTYYIRAYATNSIGTSYGAEVTATTIAALPTLSTTVVSALTATSASSGGTITGSGGAVVTARGICWSTSQNPSIADSKTSDSSGSGSFTSSLTLLTPGTTYYLRAYATNSAGTAYGNQVTMTTLAIVPMLTTTAVTALTAITATSGGIIVSDGGASITARGICWSTTTNPTTANSKTTDGSGTGNFNSVISGLTAGTTYYAKAYATNSIGTAYGNEISFTTQTVSPFLTTQVISAVTTTTANSGGNITSNGGSSITLRGVCWSTSPGPTIASNKTSDGTGSGSFISSLTGLSVATAYYVRAYATNSAGTGYGNEIVFITSSNPPTLATSIMTSITHITATSGGTISTDGGSTVTVRGVCWNTSANPTIANSKTLDGTGVGNFTSNLAGLLPTTTYYLRAYATNNAGTSYGNEVSFTTSVAPPTLTDIDGNVYNLVTIGTQTWMKENLKTTKYNDGTAIPLVTSNSAWASLSTAGYCWYDNDAATYKNVYGALYNWYVVGTEKLCPAGWQVPNNADWTLLFDNLGGTSVAFDKIKETGTLHWLTNGSATNSSGFTAMPAGYREEDDGTFNNKGIETNWWSRTFTTSIGGRTINWIECISSSGGSYYSTIKFQRGSSSILGNPNQYGFSVRCVKNY